VSAGRYWPIWLAAVPVALGPEVSPHSLIAIDNVLADRRLGVAEYGVDDLSGSDPRAILP
jgi:hypothetical protein